MANTPWVYHLCYAYCDGVDVGRLTSWKQWCVVVGYEPLVGHVPVAPVHRGLHLAARCEQTERVVELCITDDHPPIVVAKKISLRHQSVRFGRRNGGNILTSQI